MTDIEKKIRETDEAISRLRLKLAALTLYRAMLTVMKRFHVAGQMVIVGEPRDVGVVEQAEMIVNGSHDS